MRNSIDRSTHDNLEELFFPWRSAADDDDYPFNYMDLDPNDKSGLTAAVRESILDHFLSLPEARRKAIMSSLVDIQSCREYDIEMFWDGMLPPISLPDKPGDLFAWIREALDAE